MNSFQNNASINNSALPQGFTRNDLSIAPQQDNRIKVTVKKSKSDWFYGYMAKMMVGIAVLLFVLFFGFIGLYASGLDKKIFNITLNGQVFDGFIAQPIAGAEIYIGDNLITTTNQAGSFSITNLEEGELTITIKAKDYKETTEIIQVKRGFLDYSVNKDFNLSGFVSGDSVLKGKLIPNTPTYSFRDDKLLINGKTIVIKNDGTFNLEAISEGEITLSYESKSFKDFEKEFEIKAGTNELGEIQLIPAGDIEGSLKSYIKEDIINNLKIEIAGVFPDAIGLEKDGTFKVEDLDLNKEYNIRISAQGYNTKDYSVTIKQGINQIPEFKIVEEGRVYFLAKRDSDSSYHLYSSDYDGHRESKLTNTNGLNPYNLLVSSETSKIFFQTNIDGTRSTMGGRALLVYSLDLNSNELTKITTNTTNLGIVVPNYKAGKLVNITSSSVDRDQFQIFIANLNGSTQTQLTIPFTGDVKDLKLSNDGNWIYYVKQGPNGSAYGLYKINVATKQESLVTDKKDISIYDISPNGDRILFGAKNATAAFRDLLLYENSTSSTRTLMANANGNQYQFLQGSNDIILYWERQSGKDNVFRLDLSQNKTDQLTQLGFDDNIQFIHQQLGKITYKTQRGFYILDLESPKTFKLITTGDLIFRGDFDFATL